MAHDRAEFLAVAGDACDRVMEIERQDGSAITFKNLSDLREKIALLIIMGQMSKDQVWEAVDSEVRYLLDQRRPAINDRKALVGQVRACNSQSRKDVICSGCGLLADLQGRDVPVGWARQSSSSQGEAPRYFCGECGKDPTLST